MRLASCLVLLLVGRGAFAAEPAAGTYHYRIYHALFGDIGAHEVTVRHEGDRVVVEHQAHLMVELLGITAYERRSQYREVWQGDRLVAFDGLTVDNREPSRSRREPKAIISSSRARPAGASRLLQPCRASPRSP